VRPPFWRKNRKKRDWAREEKKRGDIWGGGLTTPGGETNKRDKEGVSKKGRVKTHERGGPKERSPPGKGELGREQVGTPSPFPKSVAPPLKG